MGPRRARPRLLSDSRRCCTACVRIKKVCGYLRFEAGRREVRGKSLRQLKEGIRSHTQRNGGKSLRAVIDKIIPFCHIRA
jgi:hypothetical protein